MPDDLAARLAAVREEVGAAARRAGRDAACVGIVAVTKTLPPAAVRAALAVGLADVGENYVQEAHAKRAAVGAGGTWHLIGGLQRNKVRLAVATFDHVQTVDSTAVARALAEEAARAGRRAGARRGRSRAAGAPPGRPHDHWAPGPGRANEVVF